MEECEILNPFGYGKASRLTHENRRPDYWWHDYLEVNKVLAENEFYILFEDGLLVNKGRSKFRTSQYIRGEKFQTFKEFYERI